ncbi:hypothetical protein ONZ45_g17956 [Pleurotus djamor]|nr:hypothetical protein ONZ45_g17956 [Pleurotus djamor]
MQLHLSLAGFVLLALTLVRAAPIETSEIHAKAAQGLVLLELAEGAEPVWKTEDEKLELMRAGVQFFDVTETYEIQSKIPPSAQKAVAVTFPAPSHQSTVNSIISRLSTSSMQSYLTTLSGFNNRYYRSSTGAQASTWILSTVNSIISGRSGISASNFAHSWGQSSTIVKFAGRTTTAPVTIIGSHMDSINLSNPTNGRAPGADDDGTGTVNLLEVLRVLVAAGYTPATPLEFHWYSGEEGGLLGSNAIATDYARRGVQVKAFMELDMTGYFRPGSTEVIALEADYIDSGLNTFIRQLAASYSRLPVTMDTPCGYACSDHASWYRQGYPTSMPFEAVTGNDNPVIHSASDTTSQNGFSWSHSLEFAKIAVGYVVELTS